MLGGVLERRAGSRRPSRRRRRGRSGEGIIQANRKTELCLHWQNGSCPYGASSCAFAHGLGDLRHPTLDDDMIADSVSEDSGSCPPSPGVASPSVERHQRHRERRLPTFVDLSTGHTPARREGSSRSASAPTMSSDSDAMDTPPTRRDYERRRSFPPPSSTTPDNYQYAGHPSPPAVPVSPLSTAGNSYSAQGGYYPGSRGGAMSTSATQPSMEVFGPGYGGGSVSSSTSSSWSPMPHQQPRTHPPRQGADFGRGGAGGGGMPPGFVSHQTSFPPK